MIRTLLLQYLILILEIVLQEVCHLPLQEFDAPGSFRTENYGLFPLSVGSWLPEGCSTRVARRVYI